MPREGTAVATLEDVNSSTEFVKYVSRSRGSPRFHKNALKKLNGKLLIKNELSIRENFTSQDDKIPMSALYTSPNDISPSTQ